jgi:ATP-dependent Lhr-like helicase
MFHLSCIEEKSKMAIHHQRKEMSDAVIFDSLHPITREWFQKKFGSFSPPQKFAVLDIKSKRNTLISSPTGSGKTLSAFLTIIDELVTLSEKGQLEDRIYALYISPLKALSNDIERNLNTPLKEIKELAKTKYGKKLNIRVAVRTGDTTASQKSSMLKKPPHILITTPETLAITLNTKKFSEHFKQIDWVIVDEIHSLAENKRGTHLSVSLERLNNLTQFTRIGLSATVAPLEAVAKYLIGQNTAEDVDAGIPERDCTVVDVQFIKNMDIKVLSPVKNFMDTTHAAMQRQMYRLLHDHIQGHKSTLIFTNTRSATERVVHNLKDKFPKFYGEHNIGAHHGSLSKSHRFKVEQSMKEGKLKCVVSSTSLELGIDIGSIDLVILLGSPKSVARALQRIGRSGHSLKETAKGRIIVLDRDDLVECGVLLKAAIEKKIDRINIPRNALDVIVQHIYGMAINGPVDLEHIWNTIRRSYSYETLERHQFDEIISYLAGEFSDLEVRHVYAKIWVDKETKKVGSRSKLARLIYMTNIGTIPDTTGVVVKIGEEPIGMIDEGFLERLKKGDVFVLGGSAYEFKFSRGMTAQVQTALGKPPTVPSWFSEQLPLSYDLALEIQKFRKYMEDHFINKNVTDPVKKKERIMKFIDEYLYVDKNGAEAIYEYFKQQFFYTSIPHHKKIVVEQYYDGRKKYYIFHTLFGRRVNDVLSRAVGYTIARGKDVEIGITDNGFYLSTGAKADVKKALRTLAANNLREVMDLALEKSEVLKRRFRHCASRALMILRSYRGRQKTVGRQQMSSQLLITAVKRIDPDFPILKEARREVLEDLMDIVHAMEVLEYVDIGKIKVEEVHTEVPSPFAFNLVMQGYVDILKMEDRLEFLKRMHESVLDRISGVKKKDIKESVADMKETFLEEKAERRKLTEKQIQLLEQAAIVDIPTKAKLALNNLIKGDTPESIGHMFFDQIQHHENNIVANWPMKLARFVLEKKAEFFDEHFDYQKYWDEEHSEEQEKHQEEMAEIRYDFERAARKTGMDSKLRSDGIRIIEGDLDGISKEFKEWLTGLLSGTVPKVWSTKLVKFLKQKQEEIM